MDYNKANNYISSNSSITTNNTNNSINPKYKTSRCRHFEQHGNC